MKEKEMVVLLALGLILWVAGTIYYGKSGPAFLETTRARYWTAFVLSPILSAILCVLILWWRQIPAADWATAMLLLTIPGLIGEAVVLSNLSAFMPKLRAESGGRYGAFLFMTYGIVLGLAELIALRAAP